MSSGNAVPILLIPVSPEQDHVRGSDKPEVTLVEYGDFECPHCGRAHGILDALLLRMSEQVRYVFRHFPLSHIHPHAAIAAEAAEAAGAQGRFWEMHDMLFEHQEELDEQSLIDYADALELDREQFVDQLRQRTFAERVRQEFSSGVRSGVNGTPTFFIDGLRYNGSWELRPLREAIEARIGVRAR